MTSVLKQSLKLKKAEVKNIDARINITGSKSSSTHAA
jgi:hypothetical protein